MGEGGAARSWVDAMDSGDGSPYSSSFAHWAVRALLADPASEHALRVILRHLRLAAKDARRFESHPRGSVARQIAILLRGMARGTVEAPTSVRMELSSLEQTARDAADDPARFEAHVFERAAQILARVTWDKRAATAEAAALEGTTLRAAHERRP